jgi:hypothetical protein
MAESRNSGAEARARRTYVVKQRLSLRYNR